MKCSYRLDPTLRLARILAYTPLSGRWPLTRRPLPVGHVAERGERGMDEAGPVRVALGEGNDAPAD